MIVHIINALINLAPCVLHTFTITRLHGLNVMCQLVTVHHQVFANDCSTVN
jgi:hypothetical protein